MNPSKTKEPKKLTLSEQYQKEKQKQYGIIYGKYDVNTKQYKKWN